ncbi:MAG: type II toxin-antitoxin system VapC family toxin [Burkholderiaceae bacterium]
MAHSGSDGLAPRQCLILVDTNVLVDVLENDPEWADWSIAQLRAQSRVYQLAINPIIYSELSLTFSTVEALEQVLDKMELRMLEIPRPALFLAGKAFVQYRRSRGIKSNVLGDFFIGAHAAVSGLPVLTRDTRRYKNYFPTVRLVAPSAS